MVLPLSHRSPFGVLAQLIIMQERQCLVTVAGLTMAWSKRLESHINTSNNTLQWMAAVDSYNGFPPSYIVFERPA